MCPARAVERRPPTGAGVPLLALRLNPRPASLAPLQQGPAHPLPLQRVASGDSDAVAEVIDLYGDLIWSLALRFTGSHADAEDAVQDIFLHLWRKADRFDPARGAEITFVSVLTRRILIDRYRRSAARPESAMPEALDPIDPGTPPADTSELARAAVEIFNELDEDHRIALRLAIELGRTHPEIAEITGSPLGTVKSRIRNGLRRVRDQLEHRQHGKGER